MALKQLNELYVSKRITLVVQHRGKPREIKYYITGLVTPQEDSVTFKLKALKSPNVIPKNMNNIDIVLEHDFATQKLKK